MLEHLSIPQYINFYKYYLCENLMGADNQQGRTEKTKSIKYRLSYDSIYRERDWITLAHEFRAKKDGDAIAYAQRFIEKKNKYGKNELERFELVGLEEIVQEAVQEKTIRIM